MNAVDCAGDLAEVCRDIIGSTKGCPRWRIPDCCFSRPLYTSSVYLWPAHGRCGRGHGKGRSACSVFQ